MLLVFLQPDLGTALVYIAALAAVLFVAGVRWLHLALLAVLAVTLVTSVVWLLPSAGIEVLKPYQTARLTGFTNPDADPSGLTYNLNQSITAVGAGGIDGRGVGEASQTRFDYLPEHATDFVFASFAEQRGFFGAAVLLLLYLLVVWRGLRVVTVAGDLYGAMVAGGIVFAFLFQVFVNVGMTMGIAPVTGIPLPFVTVGGSSMVANLVAIGVLAGDPRPRPAGSVPVRLLGIGPRELVALARYQRRARDVPGPLLVSGVLAEQLARELRRGGDQELVRTRGEPTEAAALVRVVAGAATAEDERLLRSATRALVPVVVVQTADVSVRLPYVLPEDVVWCSPGSGFPVGEIADRLAAGLGDHGASLAARLPVLRDAVAHRSAIDGAVSRSVPRDAEGGRGAAAPRARARPGADVVRPRRDRRARKRRRERERGRGAGARPAARRRAGNGSRRAGARPPPAAARAAGRRARRGGRDVRARGRVPPSPAPVGARVTPSGPGPRSQATTVPIRWRSRCPRPSLRKSCSRSRRRMPGSSTSSRRGVRARPATRSSSPGHGPASPSGCAPSGPAARGSALLPPERLPSPNPREAPLVALPQAMAAAFDTRSCARRAAHAVVRPRALTRGETILALVPVSTTQRGTPGGGVRRHRNARGAGSR